MHIIVASLRAPKVNGVKRAAETLVQRFGREPHSVHISSREAESGVAHTPLSLEETMRGAHHRARSVYVLQQDEETIGVGVEGGLFRAGHDVYLQSWTCAYDGQRFWFGSSGAIALPAPLASLVFDSGLELSAAIDRFAQQTDIRNRQGTYGILTNDLVTREDSFAEAALFALMPFFHRTAYAPPR